jgi:hypothetical protein
MTPTMDDDRMIDIIGDGDLTAEAQERLHEQGLLPLYQSLRQTAEVEVSDPNSLGLGAAAERRPALIIAATAIVSKCEGRIGAVLLKAARGARPRRADYAMPCRFF